MALTIKDEQTEKLARELARRTGETLTVAIRTALADRLRRVSGSRQTPDAKKRIYEILRRVDALMLNAPPGLDNRSEDEILGYDEHGLPR